MASIAGSRIPFRQSALALAFLAAAACTAFAGTTGKIAGKVIDAQTKEALVGVNLVVVGTSLGAATDIEGNYFIINIPPGTVELKVTGLGYADASFKEIRVSVDQTTRLDVELQQQAIEVGEVVITASRPIVQRDLTSTTATVSHEELAALPVETISSAVNLQAGVVEGHFRGGRSNEVKYLIDGISVNDVFSGESQLEPEISSVQEVQVLSGTFNAEYGDALSGVVNQVTKIGGDKYTGQITAYFGDYISSKTEIYKYIDNVSPTAITNIDASLSGPVPGIENFMKFFISGRSYYNDGYIYGQRIFNPSDSSNFSANDHSQWYIGNTGDGEYVSFNSEKRVSLQTKFSLTFTPTHVVNLNGLYQERDYRQYNHLFMLDPDGDYKYFQKSFLGTASYNLVVNEAAFIDARGSVFISDYKQHTYENPVDAYGNIIVSPNYVTPTRQSDVGANAFYTGGTENWNFSHHTVTWSGKLDYTNQISTLHQIKAGIDLQFHSLRYEDYQVHVEPPDYVPSLPAYGSFDFNTYKNYPYQLAGYLQDKIELDYLVVNFGVRYDYFQPDGHVLKDPENIAQLDTLSPPYPPELLRSATTKHQFSPRFGLSYPITDKGAIHVSYGHFFQIPSFQYLYNNPNFRIPQSGNFPELVGGTIGNADLQPQQTVMYEIGLQQEVAPNLGITVTAYYKDIRNLLGIEIHKKLNSRNYGTYINQDYGAVKGFTLALERRMSDNYAFTADYTFQIAQGNASDPNADYNKAQADPPIPVNKELVSLDWDRRHALNLTFTYGKALDFIASAVLRLGSGLPYTPELQRQRTGLENSENKPMYYSADLVFTKYFTMFELPVSLFVKVYNVFDTANEVTVYGSTGRSGTAVEMTRTTEPPRGVNTIAEFYNRPDYYSPPRQVLIGASLSF